MTISASSYIIYLFHTTFEGFAKAVVHKVPLFADNANTILFLANICFVIACGVIGPIVLHKFVLNKTKITKVLFGLK